MIEASVVIPFEVEFPDAGAKLAAICSRNLELPKKDRTIVDFDIETIQRSTVRTSKNRPGRNDLCSCGSGKKFKKCCIGESI